MTFVLCRDQDELHVYGESSWLTWDIKKQTNREVVVNFVQLDFGLDKFVVILMLLDMVEEKSI